MGTSCPFCRKLFAANRIVKLHVDRPATSEEGIDDVELLQRLDAEEAKRQVELEAAVVELETAVEQSKKRKRALRESLERAQRLRKKREEEAEARKQQPSTVAGNSASGAVPSPRETRNDEVFRFFTVSESSVTRTIGAAAPPSTRSGRGEGRGRRTRRGRGEGGGWSARRNTDADLTSSLASSTQALRLPPPPVNTFFTFGDFGGGNGSPGWD